MCFTDPSCLNLRFTFVLCFLICLSNLSTTKSVAAYKSGFCSSARNNKFGIGIVTSICCSSRSEEHTSELQSRFDLVCRLLLEKNKFYTHIKPRHIIKKNVII